ncbi:sterol desaturase family protein [Flavobacterium sp.]|uniref:sterol desaturase family protein n=1 Tax=Flavobacterium sp. TaxID=239 RepID=UPI00374DCE8A
MDFDFDAWLKAITNISARYFILAGTSFLIFYILLPKIFLKIKIQKLFPKTKNYYRDITYSVISMFIFSTIAYITFTLLKPYNNINYGEVTNYYWYALSFVWMFFLHDTYFYWCHRAMHHSFLYRKVHLIHHKSTNPSPWTAYAFHPLEAIIEAGIAPLIAFTIPVHRTAFFIFMLFQIIYNVYGHLGYELYPKGFNKTWIGKWVNTGTAHNQHHKLFFGNYGLYTLIWDRILGTVRDDYDATFEEVRNNN